MPSDVEIQMEAERLLMKEFSAEHQRFFEESHSTLEAVSSDQSIKKKRRFPR